MQDLQLNIFSSSHDLGLKFVWSPPPLVFSNWNLAEP